MNQLSHGCYRLVYKNGARSTLAWDWAGVRRVLSDPGVRCFVLRVEHA